jgi:hypothetical protein
LYPHYFLQALIYGFAMKIAKKIVGSTEALNSAISMYNYYLANAVEESLNRQKDIVAKKNYPKTLEARRRF